MDYVLFVCTVVLSPPFNLSVNLSGRDSEVCVSWSHVQTHCVNHTVGYWKASGSLKVSNLTPCGDV